VRVIPSPIHDIRLHLYHHSQVLNDVARVRMMPLAWKVLAYEKRARHTLPDPSLLHAGHGVEAHPTWSE